MDRDPLADSTRSPVSILGLDDDEESMDFDEEITPEIQISVTNTISRPVSASPAKISMNIPTFLPKLQSNVSVPQSKFITTKPENSPPISVAKSLINPAIVMINTSPITNVKSTFSAQHKPVNTVKSPMPIRTIESMLASSTSPQRSAQKLAVSAPAAVTSSIFSQKSLTSAGTSTVLTSRAPTQSPGTVLGPRPSMLSSAVRQASNVSTTLTRPLLRSGGPISVSSPRPLTRGHAPSPVFIPEKKQLISPGVANPLNTSSGLGFNASKSSLQTENQRNPLTIGGSTLSSSQNQPQNYKASSIIIATTNTQAGYPIQQKQHQPVSPFGTGTGTEPKLSHGVVAVSSSTSKNSLINPAPVYISPPAGSPKKIDYAKSESLPNSGAPFFAAATAARYHQQRPHSSFAPVDPLGFDSTVTNYRPPYLNTPEGYSDTHKLGSYQSNAFYAYTDAVSSMNLPVDPLAPAPTSNFATATAYKNIEDQCDVPNCRNRHTDRITLFNIPKAGARKWCEILGIPHKGKVIKDLQTCNVCSEHFDPSQFVENAQFKLLRANAVPRGPSSSGSPVSVPRIQPVEVNIPAPLPGTCFSSTINVLNPETPPTASQLPSSYPPMAVTASSLDSVSTAHQEPAIIMTNLTSSTGPLPISSQIDRSKSLEKSITQVNTEIAENVMSIPVVTKTKTEEHDFIAVKAEDSDTPLPPVKAGGGSQQAPKVNPKKPLGPKSQQLYTNKALTPVVPMGPYARPTVKISAAFLKEDDLASLVMPCEDWSINVYPAPKNKFGKPVYTLSETLLNSDCIEIVRKSITIHENWAMKFSLLSKDMSHFNLGLGASDIIDVQNVLDKFASLKVCQGLLNFNSKNSTLMTLWKGHIERFVDNTYRGNGCSLLLVSSSPNDPNLFCTKCRTVSAMINSK